MDKVHDIVQEAVMNTVLKKKKYKKAKSLSDEDIRNSWEKKRSKGEKERYTHFFLILF